MTLRSQSFRFAVVGLVSNAVLYLLYIILTWINLQPSAAVSLVFIVGALQTFTFNKAWTFSQRGTGARYIARYLTVYLGAYLTNIAALYVFVDRLACPHQLVQAGAVIVIGVLLFLVQRYWVFPSSALQKSSQIQ
ncbi:GtrA family protein [bacterium]|nr:GtrA family protein [bacterium]